VFILFISFNPNPWHFASQPDSAKAVNNIPSVSTQSATTQVLIPDGGTAVIRGILIDMDSVNVRQVPGLGNLPLIGNLFKETNAVKNTSECSSL